VFKVLRRRSTRASRPADAPDLPEQFAINLLALCVFPFAARPMVMALTGLDERGFTRFIDRPPGAGAFFLRALRP